MSNLLFLFAKFQGFISIDCGSDEDYIDEETGIPYKSDKDLIDTGIDTWWIISECMVWGYDVGSNSSENAFR